MAIDKPWTKYYGSVPITIDYPRTTLYDRLVQTVDQYPDQTAWEFLGTSYTYKKFLNDIDTLAKALYHKVGVRKGDVITISMPTSPQGIIPIYAVNKIGAISSLIHPLSPPAKIKTYLTISKSKFALTLDAFYNNLAEILNETAVEKVIIAKIPDYLSPIKKFGFKLTKGRKIPKLNLNSETYLYSDLLNNNFPEIQREKSDTNDCAVIMYSGGTTGEPKGIMLSNRNLIAEGMQAATWGNMKPLDKILAILPIFHGFGLGVCVNSAFMSGATSILVPTFTPETVADLVSKYQPQFLIGVPTLFESLSNNQKFQKANLSCLKTCFSGADTLPRSVKEKFENVVAKKGGNIKLLEGYGLTEAVTAIMAMPTAEYRENSIGVPFPDIIAKVVKIGTINEVGNNEEGELCISGPPVMLGYLNNLEETKKVLKRHDDGITWLHTGDICYKDSDNFFYFKSRLKQMIKISGYNVYPKNVEEALRKHPDVNKACVIGLPDDKKGSKLKAYIVLEPTVNNVIKKVEEIKSFVKDSLLKWEIPQEIEFRDSLPLTLLGKVDYKELERSELINCAENEIKILGDMY